MKRLLSILSILFFLGTTSGLAQTFGFPVDSASYLENTSVEVQFIANNWVLVPTEVNNRRFLPGNLDSQYEQEGLRLMVSGVIGKIPPHVRMVGTPFEIRSIAVQKKQSHSRPGQPIKLPSSAQPIDKKQQVRPDRTKQTDSVIPPAKEGTKEGKRPMIWSIKNKKGIITYNKLEGGFYSINIEGRDYVVEKLPKDFQKNGLRVIVSGKADNGRPNIFMFGPILTIEQIKLSKGAKSKKIRRKQRGKKYLKSTGQIDSKPSTAPFICGTTH